MMQARGKAVVRAICVCTPRLQQRDARLAPVTQAEAGPVVARALQRETAMAEEQLVEWPRRNRVGDGEVKVVEEIAHAASVAAELCDSPARMAACFETPLRGASRHTLDDKVPSS